MKKVLIISYSFLPQQTIGSQRPSKLAKYFPEFGWEPVVLTVKRAGVLPVGIRIIGTDYKDISGMLKSMVGLKSGEGAHEQLGIAVSKNFSEITWKSRIVRLSKEVINYPDEYRGWYRFALKSASELLSEERVDVIVSTSPSVMSHIIARKLKKKYKIPWVADLRDPWSHQYAYRKIRILKFFQRRLEIKTLLDADALVSVTKPYLDEIKTLHKNSKMFFITNGYDAGDFPDIPTKLTDKFTITYTGILYNGERDPSVLFEAVSQLMDENKINRELIEIRLYTPYLDWLVDEIRKHNLEGIVTLCGMIPRDEVLIRQRESQLLLLIRYRDKFERGDCPAKIFEYLGSKRPIIAVGGFGGIVKDLLERTNAGKFAGNVNELKDILNEYYQEFIQYGKIECHSNSNIENYTYSAITKKYSDFLNKFPLN
ncbi:MAG: glycosyltransferase family 4 protein [Planctomycetes bacterium]|nr:glycosyltransferase family 4 protein [Planctomycetota bacterium]